MILGATVRIPAEYKRGAVRLERNLRVDALQGLKFNGADIVHGEAVP
jgi:hypothetical protein